MKYIEHCLKECRFKKEKEWLEMETKSRQAEQLRLLEENERLTVGNEDLKTSLRHYIGVVSVYSKKVKSRDKDIQELKEENEKLEDALQEQRCLVGNLISENEQLKKKVSLIRHRLNNVLEAGDMDDETAHYIFDGVLEK